MIFEICRNCRNYTPSANFPLHGICDLNPPQRTPYEASIKVLGITLLKIEASPVETHPVVQNSDTCGHHEPR